LKTASRAAGFKAGGCLYIFDGSRLYNGPAQPIADSTGVNRCAGRPQAFCHEQSISAIQVRLGTAPLWR
jgi:hypothetical protein